MRIGSMTGVLTLAAILGACASTAPKPVPAAAPVPLAESGQLFGAESGVRVEASVGEMSTFTTASTISLRYAITNGRSEAIAVADLLPETSYDPDSQMITIGIGSEVPGNEFLPRLTAIPSGASRSFSTIAHLNIMTATERTSRSSMPNALRFKVSYLSDIKPFQQLIGIPERAVRDPQLADQLFPKWVEGNQTIYTNQMPIRWQGTIPTPGAERQGHP